MKRSLSLLLALLLLAAMLGSCTASTVTLKKPTKRTVTTALGEDPPVTVEYTYSEDMGLLFREEYRTVSQAGEMALLSESRVTEYSGYKSFTVTR